MSLVDLLDAVAEQARRDPAAVVPVLETLAQGPDEKRDEPLPLAAMTTAREVNQRRLEADEALFRLGSVDTAAARERLGISRQALHDRVRRGRLLAAAVGGRARYPAWQFARAGTIPGLDQVLTVLSKQCADARQADAIMRARDADLQDRSLADLLQAGHVSEVVRRLKLRLDQS